MFKAYKKKATTPAALAPAALPPSPALADHLVAKPAAVKPAAAKPAAAEPAAAKPAAAKPAAAKPPPEISDHPMKPATKPATEALAEIMTASQVAFVAPVARRAANELPAKRQRKGGAKRFAHIELDDEDGPPQIRSLPLEAGPFAGVWVPDGDKFEIIGDLDQRQRGRRNLPAGAVQMHVRVHQTQVHLLREGELEQSGEHTRLQYSDRCTRAVRCMHNDGMWISHRVVACCIGCDYSCELIITAICV